MNRREFLQLSSTLTAAGLHTACTRDAEPTSQELAVLTSIEPGESASLAFFDFENKMTEFKAEVSDRNLRTAQYTFGTPLLDPEQLRVSLINRVSFDLGPDTYHDNLKIIPAGKKGRAEISIAGLREVIRFKNLTGLPPYDSRAKSFFSLHLSFLIHEAHCLLAFKQEGLQQEHLNYFIKSYLKHLSGSQEPLLLAQMEHIHAQSPNPKPPFPMPEGLPV